MRPAPRLVGFAFGIAVALLIVLVGPLLLFNPWFVSALQEQHAVADAFGTTRDEIDRVTASLLVDLAVGGDFAVELEGAPLLDAAERSHMADVSRLVRLLIGVALGALVVALLAGRRLRGESQRMARILVVTASAVGVAGLLLAASFAVAFEATFLAFHAVFFPAGTYLFAPGSNLITLFPGGFWFDASLVAGATVILSAVVVLALGLLGRRSPPRALPAG